MAQHHMAVGASEESGQANDRGEPTGAFGHGMGSDGQRAPAAEFSQEGALGLDEHPHGLVVDDR